MTDNYLTASDYYRFVKTQPTGTRFECVSSTHSYPLLEQTACRKDNPRYGIKENDILLRSLDPQQIGYYNSHVKQKAWKTTRLNNAPFSSVYKRAPIDIYGYGDIAGTQDGIIFKYSNYQERGKDIEKGAEIEVYILRGQKAFISLICSILNEGGEEEESLKRIKATATPIHTQQPHQ